ncbi:GL26135 [Drosophila persimilis]|uniref:GL26135 n=1 Tax=Drosophila persimilis TaxID=7234 RepID=B4GKQ6_DROPE|nr:GL26135 [Drosophila persimilis]
MCRCCQNCWEDFYWNCFEERFCYDESIANYNPEDDEDYLAAQKNGQIIGRIQPATTDNNNSLTVPQQPICDQPQMRQNSSGLGLSLMSAKMHEEDYRRETQINVPTLGPEILAVFANSQIFQDHQPTKLNRISTKTYLAGIHSPNREMPTTPRVSDQDRLLRRLEGDATDSKTSPEKRITFTLAPSSAECSPEGSQTLSPKKFEAIAEEEKEDEKEDEEDSLEEVVLRPASLIDIPICCGLATTPKRILRSAKSVPHMHVRSAASETDIFSISGTVNSSQISMTPEVPFISFSNLPKNYEDTPTIEKYRVSQSLYSIQTANAARATQDDYSMPRYFRRSAMLMTQSSEVLPGSSLASMTPSATSSTSPGSSNNELRRPEKEKSKRLQMLRGNLPPLLIHSVSFKRNRDEGKQVD